MHLSLTHCHIIHKPTLQQLHVFHQKKILNNKQCKRRSRNPCHWTLCHQQLDWPKLSVITAIPVINQHPRKNNAAGNNWEKITVQYIGWPFLPTPKWFLGNIFLFYCWIRAKLPTHTHQEKSKIVQPKQLLFDFRFASPYDSIITNQKNSIIQ